MRAVLNASRETHLPTLTPAQAHEASSEQARGTPSIPINASVTTEINVSRETSRTTQAPTTALRPMRQMTQVLTSRGAKRHAAPINPSDLYAHDPHVAENRRMMGCSRSEHREGPRLRGGCPFCERREHPVIHPQASKKTNKYMFHVKHAPAETTALPPAPREWSRSARLHPGLRRAHPSTDTS